MIEEQQKKEAKRLYRRGELTIPEISNLTGISTDRLTVIFRQAFKDGELEPRDKGKALQPRVPNGQGRSAYVPTGKKRGRRKSENPKPRYMKKGYHPANKKFTEDEERQIAVDYYENGVTWSKLQEKWGIHSATMQRIRNRYSPIYGKKR